VALSPEAVDALASKGAARGVDLRPGLARVEELVRTQVASDLPFVQDAARYLIEAGGKRFRPMLVLLTGRLGGADAADERLVKAGVIVELVHISTLYHDDVIDAADVRRGAPAAHVRWSNTVAILTGDFLLARASELSAELGVEVTRVMARTIARLCAGQILEVQGSAAAGAGGVPPVRADRDHYLAVIADKTASLIESSCRLGGLLSGLAAPEVDALADYGHRLGMAFQLADDVLDIAGEEAESGKVPGTDLREGVRTMPVLLALEQDGEDSELGALLADPTDEDVDKALSMLRTHPALELARDAARLESRAAKAALDRFRGQEAAAPVLEGLDWLADYAIERLG
jgi:heptaprenyl diphosphate synthase